MAKMAPKALENDSGIGLVDAVSVLYLIFSLINIFSQQFV
jgi:hypothetical protein